MAQHDYMGSSSVFTTSGVPLGQVDYSLTLEGSTLVSGRLTFGRHFSEGAPAMPDALIGHDLLLTLDDGRWVSFRLVNAAGELDRVGGLVDAPEWGAVPAGNLYIM